MSAVAETQSWVLGGAGVISLVAAGGRVAAYRERAEPTRAYLAVALMAVGLALLLNVVPLGRTVDNLLATPNISIVISQVAAFVCAWAATEMVVLSAGRVSKRARALRAVLLGCVSVVIVLVFISGPSTTELAVVDFFVRTSGEPAWRGYWIVYALTSAVPSIYLGVSAVRHARQAMPWLRAGLVSVGAGAALCVLFNVLLLVGLAAPSTAIGVTQMAVVALGCGLITVGVALPHLPDLLSQHALRSTWSALTALYPEVRLTRRPDLRRMVTEVHDAVVVARARDELASPLICALAALPVRGADAFEETVEDLVGVSRRQLSAEWDDALWDSGAVTAR